MFHPRSVLFGVVGALALLLCLEAQARELSMEARVAAQEAIERVRHAHRVGETRSFEQAVSRDILEQKVRGYLQQSLALERFWKRPVTASMLETELERIARHTRMPERLRELYAALANDPFLIQECIGRPVLVNRLSRSLFASEVHAAPPVSTLPWQAWWDQVAPGLDPRLVQAVADEKTELLGPSGSGCTDDTWGGIPPPPESLPRTAHTAVWTGNEMIVWGGIVDTGGYAGLVNNTGGRYDPVLDRWTPTSALDAPAGRWAHSAAWTGSEMIVWGGRNVELGNSLKSGGRYDPQNDTWIPTSEVNAPSGRHQHTAVWTGSEMVVWGGATGCGGPHGGNCSRTASGGRYDPASDSWTPLSSAGTPSARALHTAEWTGNAMIVWGGSSSGSQTQNNNPLNTGARYYPATDTWLATSMVGVPSARHGHTAVWTGSEMIVWGGGNTAYEGTGARYDPLADAWTPVSTTNAPEARGDHTAVWSGARMIVWSGRASPASMGAYTYFDTGGEYDPATNTWTDTSTTAAPVARYEHTAVWTGSLMLVWGGQRRVDPSTAAHDELRTGGRYDPATGTWTAIPTRDLSLGISGHSAVWTGNEMIVWGGSRSYMLTTVLLDTGGRYDPVLDVWASTQTAGAPAPRGYHTAVWTGSEMIVWGGQGPGTFATGGRYDPVSDTWSATSEINAPTARSLHTAAWTGSEMIVWGNSSDGSGGRYDPTRDTWSPTSVADVPASRIYYTAVWTGSEMVVWGGHAPNGQDYNTGGRYDPVSDTWSPTSIAGAPASRSLHTAVWAGSEMVVWGGYDFSLVQNYASGGRYDPMTDTWNPTSMAGAPAARARHTALWTGDEMVIWGGSSDFAFGDNTGGRYDPATDTWTPTSTAGAPPGHASHTALWTGSEMLVWGGVVQYGAYSFSGARYALAVDDDGDNFDECSGDCDDSDPLVHPDAVERCDEMDNNCNDTVDEGFPTPGPIGGLVSETASSFAWAAEPVAERYDVVRGDLNGLRSSGGNFATSLLGCLEQDTTDLAAVDASPLESGHGLYYLVRGQRDCKSGSYATGQSGEQPGRDEEIQASGVGCP